MILLSCQECVKSVYMLHCMYHVYANRMHDLITTRKFNSRDCLYSIRMVVSSPDPAPKREKGLVYIECFLGLVSEFWCANQIAPCGLHVIIMWYLTIANCCCSWCVAMPKRCVIMAITWHAISCAPQRVLDVYQTLLPLWGGVWERDY